MSSSKSTYSPTFYSLGSEGVEGVEGKLVSMEGKAIVRVDGNTRAHAGVGREGGLDKIIC